MVRIHRRAFVWLAAILFIVPVITYAIVRDNNHAVVDIDDLTIHSVADAVGPPERSEVVPPEYRVESIVSGPPVDSIDNFLDWMLTNTDEDEEYLKDRWKLSQIFVLTNELQGEETIRAFLRTPREHFVRERNINRAYDDTWLPIGWGATITDPDVVSMMTTTLAVEPYHRVLEIGTGSGYQSGILSNLSNYVYTIEIIEPLQAETDALYRSMESVYPLYGNIKRMLGDGFYGWDRYAPFDRIVVTCAIDHLPPPLIRQLAADGIMVVPLGPPGRQYIMEVKKVVDEQGRLRLTRRDVYNGLSVKFIPFRDEEGTSHSTPASIEPPSAYDRRLDDDE